MRAVLVSLIVVVTCTLLYPAWSRLHADETAAQALEAAQEALQSELTRYDENVRATAHLERQLKDLMHRKSIAQAQRDAAQQASGAP